MIRVYVGDCTEYLADLVKKHDKNAYLLDYTNYKNFLQVHYNNDITVYTSLADLPKIMTNNSGRRISENSALQMIMHKADEIVYSPPDKWSDYTEEFSWNSMKLLTEYYLLEMIYLGKTVIGFDIEKESTYYQSYLNLMTTRTDNTNPNLWIAGGSDAHGVGIHSSERFGDILANKLKIPVNYITRGGSSIEYAADQIIRNDIRSGDIIVWGLVPEMRAPMANNGKVIPWTNESKIDIEVLYHETRLYKAVSSIDQVINFCQKIGIRLYILPMKASEHTWLFLTRYKQLCLHTQIYLDYGSDDVHPGPKTHQQLANDILLKIIHESKI